MNDLLRRAGASEVLHARQEWELWFLTPELAELLNGEITAARERFFVPTAEHPDAPPDA